jgi:hypothetical protein
MAQEKIDENASARIRQEDKGHSQAMYTLHVLTDLCGPRLAGWPNHEAAAHRVAEQLTKWGFQNAKREPWDFGHPGWLNDPAIVVAAEVWHIANRDTLLPRFTTEQMPAPPPARGGRGGAPAAPPGGGGR